MFRKHSTLIGLPVASLVQTACSGPVNEASQARGIPWWLWLLVIVVLTVSIGLRLISRKGKEVPTTKPEAAAPPAKPEVVVPTAELEPPPTATKVEQVFVSYDSEDTQFAHRLADDLQRLGVKIWISPESIHPGESWVSAIERGLRESSHIVVVLTPAVLESKWVRKETEIAVAQERKDRIRVIPLEVKRCEVPLLLSSYQMVSFRYDYYTGLSQLATILGVRVK